MGEKNECGLSEIVWDEVLGTRNNNKPIIAKSNKLIRYDLDRHIPYDFIILYSYLTHYHYYEEGCKPTFFIFLFVRTLVLLDIDRNN